MVSKGATWPTLGIPGLYIRNTMKKAITKQKKNFRYFRSEYERNQVSSEQPFRVLIL